MAKIDRHTGNLTPFAKDADPGGRNTFGGLTPSDTLDDNLNDSYEEGWTAVTSPTLWPKLRDFNAAMFTAGQILAYMIQRGVPEYHAEQEYFIGSMCSFEGVIHISLTDGNTGNLLTDSLKWKNLIGTDSIGTLELAANAVQTSNILSNAVTLAKLAHGTAYKLIGFNGAGVPVEAAPPLGVDQTWVKYTNKVSGMVYINETEKPIFVVINSSGSSDCSMFVDGFLLAFLQNDFHNERMLSLVVPKDSTYEFVGSHNNWHELR